MHNPKGIKLLIILLYIRLAFSHLNKQRFDCNFESCIGSLSTCSLEVELTSHFFVLCHYYNELKLPLFTDLRKIDENLSKLSNDILVSILLYGCTKYDYNGNQFIIKSFINFILKTQ